MNKETIDSIFEEVSDFVEGVNVSLCAPCFAPTYMRKARDNPGGTVSTAYGLGFMASYLTIGAVGANMISNALYTNNYNPLLVFAGALAVKNAFSTAYEIGRKSGRRTAVEDVEEAGSR